MSQFPSDQLPPDPFVPARADQDSALANLAPPIEGSGLDPYDELATKPARRRREPKVPREPRTPRGARRSRAAQDTNASGDLITVVPVLTSFDLLEGSYQKVIRARMGMMAMAGAFALVVLLLLGYGIQERLNNSNATTKLTSTQLGIQKLESTLGTDTNYTAPDGVTYNGTRMQGDLAFRSPLVKLAVGAAPDVARILSDFQSLAGPGITVTGVQIDPSLALGQAPITTTTIKGTLPTASGVPVSINVVALSYQDFNNFISKVKRFSYLTGVTPSAGGAPPSINASISATVLNLPYPVPAAANTTSTGGSNG